MTVLRFPMTSAGAQAMRQELEKLKTQDRPQVIEAIAEARAHGDLKENAEYHAARERQGFIEGRIKELEYKLANANVIELADIPRNGLVIFGTTVDLEDANSGEELSYKIVGEDEADVNSGLISNTSPIARALLGKEEGETVHVNTPSGTRTFDIIAVRYV